MAKKRWQQIGSNPPPRPTSSGTAPPKPTDPGRWKGRRAPGEGLNRAAVKGIAGVFALVLVLSGLLAVLLWLNPVPRPRLEIFSARYRTDLLPPNAMALADAEVLTHQTQSLDPAGGAPQSLAVDELQARISSLATVAPRRNWFSWEKTTTLAYVNMLGVALYDPAKSRAVPYLLPENFEVWTQSQQGQVPVRSLLEALLACPADQKVLVLDCQRIDHLWPLGVLANDFVRAVESELSEIAASTPEKLNGLAVFFSCGPEQVTWVDSDAGQSAYGYYFARGIAGEADESGGDGDGRLSLGELAQYVETNVVNWSARNRADLQRPMVRTFGIELEAPLLSLGRDASFQPLPKETKAAQDVENAPVATPGSDYLEMTSVQDRSETDLKAELQKGWQTYYELGHEALPPWRYGAEIWSDMQETLLQSEALLLARDLSGLREQLRKLPVRREALERAKKSYTLSGPSFSLPMQQLLGNVDPGFAPILEEVTSGRVTIPVAANQLSEARFAQESFPIEAHFLRILSERLLSDPNFPLPAAQLSEAAKEATSLVALRALAEKAAVPGTAVAADVPPDIFRWALTRVNAADRLRRLREDQLFGMAATLIDMEAEALPGDNDASRALYETSAAESGLIAEAFVLRQALLAELPSIVNMVAARPWVHEDQSFTESVRAHCQELLSLAADLGETLDSDPTRLESISAVVDKVKSMLKSAAQHRQEVMSLLSQEARELGATGQPPRDQNDWHRVHDILKVPFPADPRDAAESARIRMNLLRRVAASVQQESRAAGSDSTTDSQTLATLSETDRRQHIERSADLANRLYGLGLGTRAELTGLKPDAMGAKLGESWRKLYDLAVITSPPAGDYPALLRADASRRILDGYAAYRSRGPQELRRFNVSEMFAWQSRRFAEDFWAGSTGDPRPYFERSAEAYLDQAQSMAPRDAAWLVSTRQLLERLKPLSRALELRSPEETIPFRGASKKAFSLEIERPSGYPTGVATFRSRIVDPERVSIQVPPRLAIGTPVPLELTRNDASGAKGATTLDATLLFRGHVDQLPLEVELVDFEVGPTVVYRMGRQGDGKISVRLDKAERSLRKLLLVLDLSGSMSERDKIATLRKVLAQFADSIDEGSVDVGVRFLGHRVPWVGNADPKLLPDALQDTELVLPISPFQRDAFDAILGSIKPVGGTPLYQAVAAAKRDLEAVAGEEKTILIISDGADRFLGQPGYPSIQTLTSAYKGSGIEINAVGFGFEKGDDFGQLQAIVKAGSTGGEVVRAENADELLKQITRLSGVFSWAAHTANRSYPDNGQRLGVIARPVPVPPAAYDLRVVNSRGDKVDERIPVRVAAGELHAFALRGRKIDYEYDDFPSAIAGAEDKSTGVTLRVLEARPTQPAAPGRPPGIFLKLALFKKSQPAWRPGSIGLFVYPRDRDVMYSCQHLTWNEPDYHYPVWGITIEDWPQEVREADVEVRWREPDEPMQAYRLSFADWRSQGSAGKLPAGIRLESWVTSQIALGNETKNVTRLLFEFPRETADFREWSVNFGDQQVSYARQVTNGEAHVLSGRYVLQNEEDPKEIVLYPPMPRQEGQVAKTRFRIGGNPLFEN